MRLFVLGSNGLLGRRVAIEALKQGFEPILISRATFANLQQRLKNPDEFVRSLQLAKDDFVVNAIGVTRHRIEIGANGADAKSVQLVNTELPCALGRLSLETGAQVLQIGTDCVFSGKRGKYLENDHFDAFDSYGKSKALGEGAPGIGVVRASFVGPTGFPSPYLWDWVQFQKPQARLEGYANVFWNGVTAEVHARLMVAMVKNRYPLLATQHLVPANYVSKEQLVRLIASRTGRKDIFIETTQLESPKNMTLSTQNKSINKELWELISYSEVPTIEELLLRDAGTL